MSLGCPILMSIDCFVFCVNLCFIFYQQWNQVQWDGWTLCICRNVNCVLFNIFFHFLSLTILFLPAGWPNWMDFNEDAMNGLSIRRQPKVIRNLYPFSHFWNVLIIAHFPDCFYIFAASHNATGYLYEERGKENFIMAALFHFFKPFLLFSFWFFVCRFSWGAFSKI